MNAIAHMTAQVMASTHQMSRRTGMPVKPELKEQILKALAAGKTYNQIAMDLRVSRDTISKVKRTRGTL